MGTKSSSEKDEFTKKKKSIELPKVNIPNLPENVLDEVYQNSGIFVMYSDIRDVKEMPESEREDYQKRQKYAHTLAGDSRQRTFFFWRRAER